jgi:hypothetical protein
LYIHRSSFVRQFKSYSRSAVCEAQRQRSGRQLHRLVKRGVARVLFLLFLYPFCSNHDEGYCTWLSTSILPAVPSTILYEAIPRLKVNFSPVIQLQINLTRELNPAEYIWNQTDRALANTAPQDLEELQALLSNSVAKMGNSQKLLWSCIYTSDLPWR